LLVGLSGSGEKNENCGAAGADVIDVRGLHFVVVEYFATITYLRRFVFVRVRFDSFGDVIDRQRITIADYLDYCIAYDCKINRLVFEVLVVYSRSE